MLHHEDASAAVLPSSAINVSWILGHRTLPAHVEADSIAIVWDGGRITYGELRERSYALASALRGKVDVGGRVAAQLTNRPEIFELYFACAIAGLTLVPLNFRLTARELAFILDDCQPAVFVSQTSLRETVDAAFAAADVPPHALVTLEDDSAGAEWEALLDEGAAHVAPAHTDVHLILYTSGTTGRPKGVMMRHQSILWFATQQAIYYPHMNQSTVTMLTGPMYNTAAINEQSIPTLYVGGAVAIMPSGGWRPESMAERMDAWGVTHAVIYPSMMEPMIAARSDHAVALGTLRCAVTGGENCPPATMARFMETWPHVELIVAYGSTECGVASLVKGAEVLRKPGSVGRAIGGQLFEIVNEDRRPVPPGTVGRILTAGPSIVPGYWSAPELTSAAIDEGWLDTGDLGRMDEEGFLYIEGRTKDMIISKGQNIYPAEIENVLMEHPAIVDCAVFGVPDAECGEVPCAAVVIEGGASADAEEIIGFVRERLASFKKPKYVIGVTEIPRNPSKKVLKRELADDLRAAGRIPS